MHLLCEAFAGGAASNIWLVFFKGVCCYLACKQDSLTTGSRCHTYFKADHQQRQVEELSDTRRLNYTCFAHGSDKKICSYVMPGTITETPGAWGKPTPQTSLCPSLLCWETALEVLLSETKPLYMWMSAKPCSGSYTGRWTESTFWLRCCNVLLLPCFEIHLFISPQSTRPLWQLEQSHVVFWPSKYLGFFFLVFGLLCWTPPRTTLAGISLLMLTWETLTWVVSGWFSAHPGPSLLAWSDDPQKWKRCISPVQPLAGENLFFLRFMFPPPIT